MSGSFDSIRFVVYVWRICEKKRTGRRRQLAFTSAVLTGKRGDRLQQVNIMKVYSKLLTRDTARWYKIITRMVL